MLGSIITAAPEMLKVAKTIERVATADVSVMLLGASGTGKELLARAVHEKSGAQGRVHRHQLRRDPREPARGRAVRLRARRLHRRGQVERRQDRAGAGRHPVPRRGRRHSAAAPGQAAALPPGARDRAHRRAPADRGRHADRLRDAPGPRCDDRRRPLPRGPLLPPRRDRGEDPVARRALGRRGPACAAFRQPLRPRAQPGVQSLSPDARRRQSTPMPGRATSASSRTASSAR